LHDAEPRPELYIVKHSALLSHRPESKARTIWLVFEESWVSMPLNFIEVTSALAELTVDMNTWP
jgi:hypothetical protein